PDAFRQLSEGLIGADDQVGAIVGAGYRSDERGRILAKRYLPVINYETILYWLQPDYFTQPSCFFTRAAWEQCGPLDTTLRYSMDLALWLEIARKFEFRRLDAVLSNTLAHSNAKTMAEVEHSSVDTALVLARHGREDLARWH